MGYFEEMQRLRRQLLDQYWPKIEPVVTRLLEKQRTPLTQVQIEAVSALIAETFHLAKVDRIYLDMLIKRLEARVLGYGPASESPEDTGRYITISDCEFMTPLQFCRVIRHLFAKFGYQGACEGETWLELHHSSGGSQRILAYLEVKNRIVHEADITELLSLKKQKAVERALFITVGTYDSESWDLATQQGIELWDGHQLAALLDRVRLPAGAMLD